MGFRDKFKDENDTGADKNSSSNHNGAAPEIIFVRSDTNSVNVLQPDDDDDDHHQSDRLPDTSRLSPAKEPGTLRRSLSIFRPSRSRSTSVSSQASHHSSSNKDAQPGGRRRRLSERLHLRHHHHHHESSDSVPPDLPAIVAPPPAGPDPDPSTRDAVESQWEQRATLLAGQNELARSASVSPTRRRDWSPAGRHDMASLDQVARGGAGVAAATTTAETIAAVLSPGSPGIRCRSRSPSAATQPISSEAIDENIQEAIRLHEEGDLQRSTQIFGRLADSNGANNPLSQVLYGLALRHGWGCAPDTEKAVTYLSAAASNAAAVEELALRAGMKKGGAAKGELILAIFELANCFRHGWGIPKDAVAAKQYYETAANLGDTDAMNEAAWCYLEGFGCKKDKFTAAQYYRLAENAGNKTLGNSWIWKEKYNPGENQGKKKRR